MIFYDLIKQNLKKQRKYLVTPLDFFFNLVGFYETGLIFNMFDAKLNDLRRYMRSVWSISFFWLKFSAFWLKFVHFNEWYLFMLHSLGTWLMQKRGNSYRLEGPSIRLKRVWTRGKVLSLTLSSSALFSIFLDSFVQNIQIIFVLINEIIAKTLKMLLKMCWSLLNVCEL